MAWVLAVVFAAVPGWHGVYHDGPIAVTIVANRPSYRAGDTFRLRVRATNQSDRSVLLKTGWREQLSCYHLHPLTGEQIEWPGRVLRAAPLESTEVVRLAPGRSHEESRDVRVFVPADASTFQFRLTLRGVRDLTGRVDAWQGVVWSNPISVTVR